MSYGRVNMRDVSSQNFGLLIAYLLPGFTVLWGISHVSPIVQSWIGTTTADAPTVGGFLYVTLASVAAGMTMSTIRWAIIDRLHHLMGIRQPDWNFSQMANRVTAFSTLIEIHYRFYQWYSNMLISLPLAFTFRWYASEFRLLELIGLMLIEVLFFVGSRDTLRKYYIRVQSLLQEN